MRQFLCTVERHVRAGVMKQQTPWVSTQHLRTYVDLQVQIALSLGKVQTILSHNYTPEYLRDLELATTISLITHCTMSMPPLGTIPGPDSQCPCIYFQPVSILARQFTHVC